MLDEFGTELENTDSKLDTTMKKVAKVLHLSNGKNTFSFFLFQNLFKLILVKINFVISFFAKKIKQALKTIATATDSESSKRLLVTQLTTKRNIIFNGMYKECCDICCRSSSVGSYNSFSNNSVNCDTFVYFEMIRQS